MKSLVEKDIKTGQDPESRPSLREEQKRLTYERLLNAAQQLFEMPGADDVTIEDIAQRAGTNRTTFYLHFEDRADIAFKIRSSYLHGDIDSIARFVAKSGEGISRDEIRKWIKNRAAFFRKHKAIIELGSEALHRRPALMLEFITQTNEVLTKGFKSFLEQFDSEERERVSAELLLYAVMLNRYLYITVVQDLEFPIKAVPDVLVEMWYGLLSRKPGKDRDS